MKTKITICLACVILSACATPIKTQPQATNEIKYAISYCLSSSYPDSEFSKDSGYISGAYIQKGDYGLNMYEQIREFVTVYKQKKYVSKNNRNLDIMQCIDLIESEELKIIIDKP